MKLPATVYIATINHRYNDLYCEVGKTYTITGENRGFTFRKDLSGVIHEFRRHKPPKNEVDVFEVKIPESAKIMSESENKILVNRFQVVRKLTKEEIEEITNGKVKFDEEGRLKEIHCPPCSLYPKGLTKYLRYDDQNRLIYLKEIDGEKIKIEKRNYEKQLTLIYEKEDTGIWSVKVYKNDLLMFANHSDSGRFRCREIKIGKFGKILWEEDDYGYWYLERYDKNDQTLYRADSTGIVEQFKYDDKNNIIEYKRNEKVVYRIEIE